MCSRSCRTRKRAPGGSSSWSARGDGSAELKATALNEGWLGGVALSVPERLAWQVADKAFEFAGPFWRERERHVRLSPIGYVENVKAATLILHGEHDYRAPIAHAEQWFLSLRLLGVPVEMVRYPRSAHAFDEPWLLVDSRERVRSWFVHWLVEKAGKEAAWSR